MITKWGKLALAMCYVIDPTAYAPGYIKAKDVSGNTRYLAARSNDFPTNVRWGIVTNRTSNGVVIGSGTTAPTETDYTLESMLTSGFSSSYTEVAGSDDDGNPKTVGTYTITNTGSADLTIGEVGFQQRVSASTTSGGTTMQNTYLLFDRTVLSSPLVIPAGESGVLVYTLKADISAIKWE